VSLGGRKAGRLALVASLFVLVAGVDRIHTGMPSTPKSARGEAFVPQPQLAKFASLGFDDLVADYYWLQAVQLVGATVADPSVHGYTIGRLIDVVTQLNPHVGHPYRFAAIWMTASEEDVRFANHLLERGIEHHPDDWRNPFYKGFNHFYYLHEYEEAADALARAARHQGAPPYLNRLVPRLRSQAEGLEIAGTMLMELHRETQDPAARAEYEKALDEIETERRARRLDTAREEFQRRHGRDIRDVSELVAGANPVLRALPPELHGWEWVLHETTGEIVSSYYQARYTVHRTLRPGKRFSSGAGPGSHEGPAGG